MHEKYFKILELSPGAGKEAIKKAYRRLAKKYHPDVCQLPDAHDKFIAVCEAYEMLLNTTKSITDLNREAKEAWMKEMKERAKRRAEAQKDKLRQEMEEYKKSGLYDFAILIKYIFSIIFPLIGISLIVLTIAKGFFEPDNTFAKYIPVGVLGLLILSYVAYKYKTWFKQGKFYYTRKMILEKLKLKNELSASECYYSKGRNANSKPYKIVMVKVKNIRLSRQGAFSGNVEYKRVYRNLEIPRSLFAYRIHLLVMFLKIVIITLSVVYLQFDSYLWRLITGIFASGLFSTLIYFATSVKSRADYLFNKGMVIRILVWLNVLILVTRVSPGPDFSNTYFTYNALFLLIFFDAVLQSIIDGTPGNFAQQPAFSEPSQVSAHKEKGFRNFLNIPVITTVFPFIKWLFG